MPAKQKTKKIYLNNGHCKNIILAPKNLRIACGSLGIDIQISDLPDALQVMRIIRRGIDLR